MTIQEQLHIIQRVTGLTQTKLADRFGVSFAAFNGWWTGKSLPRPRMQEKISEFFLEITGQKIVPANQLTAKKQALTQKSQARKSIISEILAAPDIRDMFTLKLTYHSNRIEENA